LGASMLLTWRSGLNGVVLGTTIPFVLIFPIFLRKTLSILPVTLSALVRSAWLPAYGTGVLLALVLIVLRLVVSIDSLAELIGFLVAGPLLYWLAFYSVWTTPGERALVRDLLRGGASHLIPSRTRIG
jgi:hypothetical protein